MRQCFLALVLHVFFADADRAGLISDLDDEADNDLDENVRGSADNDLEQNARASADNDLEQNEMASADNDLQENEMDSEESTEESRYGEQADSSQVELTGRNATLVLSTEEDLHFMEKQIEEQIAEVRKQLASATASAFEALSQQLQEEMQSLQDRSRTFLKKTHQELAELQDKEWRLQLAVRHGVLGRCCCEPTSAATCQWVDLGLLEGRDRQCPTRSGVDYIDHYANRLQAQVNNEVMESYVVPTSTLIDSCRASIGWQQHVQGITDRLSQAIPADAVKAIEEMAGGIVEGNMVDV